MSYTSNFHETFYDLQYTVKFQTDVRHRFVALAKKKYEMISFPSVFLKASAAETVAKFQNAILVWCHYKISNLFSDIIVWQNVPTSFFKGKSQSCTKLEFWNFL